ncbi:hypothetical protein [Aureimonas pseudogalii]|uniref:Uncharacterized protein n=1 Tax=Aureimonas pseudogalii TaxID=1744844 RepID=A0A7W6EAE0_9HYPH|nr:hypothetical protein [Aureimonas pseudogalii]MBB3997254.1 hypothetical protein [Aureimonas pseudogalii]
MSTEPTSHPDTAYCIACDKPMQNGQLYYPDVSGGELHAECCGPERECYTLDGEPLPEGEPIPAPRVWYEEPVTFSGPPRPSAAQELAWHNEPIMSDSDHDLEKGRDPHAMVNDLSHPAKSPCTEQEVAVDPVLPPENAPVTDLPVSSEGVGQEPANAFEMIYRLGVQDACAMIAPPEDMTDGELTPYGLGKRTVTAWAKRELINPQSAWRSDAARAAISQATRSEPST